MTGFLSLCILLFLPTEAPLQHQEMLQQRVNVHTHGRQQSMTLDSHDTGLVAVWTSQRQEDGSSGIYGRVLGPLLRPLGPEHHLNAQRAGTQERPAVALSDDGHVWVAWQSNSGDGSRIILRRFDADLLPLGDEIAVETSPQGVATRPTLDVAANGHLLVSWQVYAPQTETAAGVRSRLFDAEGQPLSEDIVLSTAPSAGLPGTVVLDEQHFAVVWAQKDSQQSRLYAASLSTEDGRLVRSLPLHTASSNPTPSGSAIEPTLSVGQDAQGHTQLAVTWMQSPSTITQSAYDVWAQRFDVNLEPIAETFLVARGTTGWQSGATVQHLQDGRLAVLHNVDSSHGKDVWLHTFDANDQADSWPRPMHVTRERHQLLPSASTAQRVVRVGTDGLAVAWQGASDGDGHGVHVTALVSPQVVAEHATFEPTVEPAVEPAIEPTVDVAAHSAASTVTTAQPIWKPNFRPSPRLEGLLGGNDFGFEAIAETPWSPPDPEIAVGPDQVLFTSNGALTAFAKDGTQQWVDEIEGSDGFWGALGAGGLVFDPEVVWDPHSQRFVAMANEDTNNLPYFLLAVSRDAHPDDADDWHKYRFEVSAFTAGATFIDSPNLGLNRDYIFLTADFFGPDKYLLYVVDKASVLEGGAALTAADLITGTQSMGIPVVRDPDNSALYIVESTEFGANDTVILHAVTDPFGSFDREEVEIDVDPYSFPIDPPQRDTTVRPELFEPRFWSVAHAGDSLWAVHHVDSTRVRVRWYEFNLNGWPDAVGTTPTLAQSGEIDLGDGIHTFFPSLDADAQGNAAITFSRSATDEYISIWRAVRLASMPAGTFGPAVMVQESANAQTDGRWGDYSGTQADPASPGVFWGIHQFTNGDTGSWRTWAARYDDAVGLFGDGFESGDTAAWSSSMP